MAETEVEIYVATPDDKVIDKVEALFLCDNETDFREIVASLGAEAGDELGLDPEFTPEEIKLFKGYLRADFTAGSDGDDIARAWTSLLCQIILDSTVHAWGHQDGMWEFWCRGEKGKVENRQDEPGGDDKASVDNIYPWWHEGLPPGVKTGLLARKFKRPGRKPAARKKTAAKKSANKYKNFHAAWCERDYDYIAEKVTRRNLYSKQDYGTNPEMLMQFGLRMPDERLVQIVLDAGFDVNHTDIGGDGWALLHWMCSRFGRNGRNMEPFVPLIIAQGADVHAEGGHAGHTPLWYACKEGRPLAVKALCDAGTDANLANFRGETPLFNLAYARDDAEVADIVDTLVAAGADLHHRCDAGKTALFPMGFRRGTHGVRRMIELGIDPLAEDNEGKRAFDRSSSLRELLLQEGHIQPADLRTA